MEGFTLGAVLAGISTTAIFVAANFLGRGYLLPKAKQVLHDGPIFEGDWCAQLAGEGGETFDASLKVSHYSPYVRGEFVTKKSKSNDPGPTSRSRMTGFICDNFISMSCRTTLKDRRSICTLMLSICPQSKEMQGEFVFRKLDDNTIFSHPVIFKRAPC